jgi:hypothetical protein
MEGLYHCTAAHSFCFDSSLAYSDVHSGQRTPSLEEVESPLRKNWFSRLHF